MTCIRIDNETAMGDTVGVNIYIAGVVSVEDGIEACVPDLLK